MVLNEKIVVDLHGWCKSDEEKNIGVQTFFKVTHYDNVTFIAFFFTESPCCKKNSYVLNDLLESC